jgi:hypothetical protein
LGWLHVSEYRYANSRNVDFDSIHDDCCP